MREGIIGKKYAKVLFELATESGVVKRIRKELEFVMALLIRFPEWKNAMDNEEITSANKQRMIGEISAFGGFHDFTKNILILLAGKMRMHLIPLVAACFDAEDLRYRGIVNVKVTVADQDIFSELEEDIIAATRNICKADVKLEYDVDPSIIGGLIIEAEDIVYDGSIKGEMKRFREYLMEKRADLYDD